MDVDAKSPPPIEIDMTSMLKKTIQIDKPSKFYRDWKKTKTFLY